MKDMIHVRFPINGNDPDDFSTILKRVWDLNENYEVKKMFKNLTKDVRIEYSNTGIASQFRIKNIPEPGNLGKILCIYKLPNTKVYFLYIDNTKAIFVLDMNNNKVELLYNNLVH